MSNYEDFHVEEPELKNRADDVFNQKNTFSKVLVVILLLFVIAIVAAVFYFNWHGKIVQEYLIGIALAAILGEWALISKITRQKIELQKKFLESERGNQ